MNITIERIGPYGVLAGGSWHSLGKGVTLDNFEVGKAYEATIFEKSGKKYINKLGDSTAPLLDADANKLSREVVAEAKKNFKPTPSQYGKPLSEYELAKDVRIARSGIIQASLQAVTPHVANKEQLLVAAIEVSEGALKWVYQTD